MVRLEWAARLELKKPMPHKLVKKYTLPAAAALFFALAGCAQLSDMTDAITRPPMPAADNDNHPAAMRENTAGDAQPATATSVLNGLISFPE